MRKKKRKKSSYSINYLHYYYMTVLGKKLLKTYVCFVGHDDFVLSSSEGVDHRSQFYVLSGKHTGQFFKKISLRVSDKVVLISFEKLYRCLSVTSMQHLQVKMTEHWIQQAQ